jgi:septin family protein
MKTRRNSSMDIQLMKMLAARHNIIGVVATHTITYYGEDKIFKYKGANKEDGKIYDITCYRDYFTIIEEENDGPIIFDDFVNYELLRTREDRIPW